MNKVYCVGELLIDMISKECKSLKDTTIFEKKAGGAPANVACAIAKMNKKAEFMGQIGADFFGDFLLETLEKYNIETNLSYREGNTTLAFVSIDENGERDFSFMKGCDGEYDYKKFNFSIIGNKDIIHFGSATALLESKLKQTYFKLLEYAKEKNIFISFDPNYRDSLIKDDLLKEYIEDSKKFIKYSDFVKMSDEEITLISGKNDINKGIEYIHSLGAKIIAVTLGSKGTLLSFMGQNKIIGSIKIKQVDSTGAGDAFVGAFLSEILEYINNDIQLNFEILEDICKFANKIGAITCTNYGAMDSIPNKKQV